MGGETTVKADHDWSDRRPLFPGGLLRFYPLERPPCMSFFALDGQRAELGRDPDCAVSLDDREASRRHARLERRDDGWLLADNGSTNGVFVDGVRVEEHLLQDGQVIRVGSTFLRFLEHGPGPRTCSVSVRTGGLVGGPSLEEARAWLDRAAPSDLAVLVEGETGTGKEVAARYLHERSPRAAGPFVPVNCAALPASLAESELFGHVRGAFSGAVADRAGLFRQASGGTLFLDEVGELPQDVQAKLLRVLQDRRVRPVGGRSAAEVDVRFVCATNRDLEEGVRQGRFRSDLLARLAQVTVSLPPLRRRREDIPLLVLHFLGLHHRRPARPPSTELVEALCCRPYPRNVRQLENLVRRALLLLEPGEELGPRHFPPEPDDPGRDPPQTAPAPGAADPRVAELDAVLRRFSGDAELAARHLGISRSQLYRRARKLGLWIPDYRS